VEIDEGAESLTCMRLRPAGLVRWYTRCCRTPIGNTLATHRAPFVGLIHACVDLEAAGLPADVALGPVRARVYGRFARGDRSQLEAHDRVPVSLLMGVARLVLAARLRGDHRRSPFFRRTGELVSAPRVLSPEELRALEQRRLAEVERG
jgi:hypothetical protein